MTMVRFDCRFCTALCNCPTVLTHVTVADGGGGGPKLGASDGNAGTMRDSSDSKQRRIIWAAMPSPFRTIE
jgi:hypothetical protein